MWQGACGLAESDAWPAQPQDAYGLEKLMTEELLMHYDAVRCSHSCRVYGLLPRVRVSWSVARQRQGWQYGIGDGSVAADTGVKKTLPYGCRGT